MIAAHPRSPASCLGHQEMDRLAHRILMDEQLDIIFSNIQEIFRLNYTFLLQVRSMVVVVLVMLMLLLLLMVLVVLVSMVIAHVDHCSCVMWSTRSNTRHTTVRPRIYIRHRGVHMHHTHTHIHTHTHTHSHTPVCAILYII